MSDTCDAQQIGPRACTCRDCLKHQVETLTKALAEACADADRWHTDYDALALEKDSWTDRDRLSDAWRQRALAAEKDVDRLSIAATRDRNRLEQAESERDRAREVADSLADALLPGTAKITPEAALDEIDRLREAERQRDAWEWAAKDAQRLRDEYARQRNEALARVEEGVAEWDKERAAHAKDEEALRAARVAIEQVEIAAGDVIAHIERRTRALPPVSPETVAVFRLRRALSSARTVMENECPSCALSRRTDVAVWGGHTCGTKETT